MAPVIDGKAATLILKIETRKGLKSLFLVFPYYEDSCLHLTSTLHSQLLLLHSVTESLSNFFSQTNIGFLLERCVGFR